MTIDLKINPSQQEPYAIFVQSLKDSLEHLKIICNGTNKIAIVTNDHIKKLHLAYLKQYLNCKVLEIIINDGEQYKTMESTEFILNQLFQNRFDRNSKLIAFGGGVIGDITGFAASIYQRGIDFYQIPTTLLACIDSSIGGKTGVNNNFGKNLIGTFHQPKAVFIDLYFLSTLAQNQFFAAMAEMIKIAIMFDKTFFHELATKTLTLNDYKRLQKSIIKALKLKIAVVKADEKEQGIRSVLNYGHTFGHVIEKIGSYKTFLHGEAVAKGIIIANALAVKLGYLSKQDQDLIAQTLKNYHLFDPYHIVDLNAFTDLLFLDKKSSGNQLTFILPKNIGDFYIYKNADERLLRSILQSFT